MPLTHNLILLYSLSFAFFIVEVLPKRIRIQKVKPFNCLMCMTGWSAFTLAIIDGYKFNAIGVMFAGVFVGAIFDAIKMRWL